jgi:HEAT repeat protein
VLSGVPWLDPARLVAALGAGDAPSEDLVTLLAQGGARSLPALLHALGSPDGQVRDGAELALTRIGPPAFPSLVARLRDPSVRARLGAARALAGAGWSPASPREAFAFHAASRDWQAIAAMGQEALPFLTECLGDPHPGVREAAARTIGRCDATTAARILCELLARDPEEEVRSAAAEGLGLLADPAAVPALRAALEDPSHVVRLAAATALAGLGWAPPDEDALGALLVATMQWTALERLGAAAVPRLIRVLADGSYGVRRGATGTLLAIGSIARPALERARDDPDPGVRDGVAVLLSRMGPVPGGEEPAPGPASLSVAGGMGEADAGGSPAPPDRTDGEQLGLVAGRLSIGSPAEQLEAASALGEVDPDPALDAAAASPGSSASPAAITLLVDRLADPDEDVRASAIRALATTGEAAVPALVAALDRPEREIRAGAAGLLARAGYAPVSDREGILLALGLEDWHGLARFGELAVEPLGALLDSPDQHLRLGAVIALGEIGGEQADALVRRACADPAPAVRNRAALLLQLRPRGE